MLPIDLCHIISKKQTGKGADGQDPLCCCPIPWQNLVITWTNPRITLEQPHGPAEMGTPMKDWGFKMESFSLTCAVHPKKPQAHWEAQAVRSPDLQGMALPTYTVPSSPALGFGQHLHHQSNIETRRRFLNHPPLGVLGNDWNVLQRCAPNFP